MEIERNQQLASMIGRRLREACGSDMVNDLPTAIADKLAVLREVEASRAAMGGASLSGAAGAVDQGSLMYPLIDSGPLDAKP